MENKRFKMHMTADFNVYLRAKDKESAVKKLKKWIEDGSLNYSRHLQIDSVEDANG